MNEVSNLKAQLEITDHQLVKERHENEQLRLENQLLQDKINGLTIELDHTRKLLHASIKNTDRALSMLYKVA
jgi:regulator of replication initiation timing